MIVSYYKKQSVFLFSSFFLLLGLATLIPKISFAQSPDFNTQWEKVNGRVDYSKDELIMPRQRYLFSELESRIDHIGSISNGLLYFSHSIGKFYSVDGGEVWKPIQFKDAMGNRVSQLLSLYMLRNTKDFLVLLPRGSCSHLGCYPSEEYSTFISYDGEKWQKASSIAFDPQAYSILRDQPSMPLLKQNDPGVFNYVSKNLQESLLSTKDFSVICHLAEGTISIDTSLTVLYQENGRWVPGKPGKWGAKVDASRIYSPCKGEYYIFDRGKDIVLKSSDLRIFDQVDYEYWDKSMLLSPIIICNIFGAFIPQEADRYGRGPKEFMFRAFDKDETWVNLGVTDMKRIILSKSSRYLFGIRKSGLYKSKIPVNICGGCKDDK